MEIGLDALRKTRLKFHEDDIHAKPKRLELRNVDNEKNLPINIFYKSKRIKVKAHSAPISSTEQNDDYLSRLFTNVRNAGLRAKIELHNLDPNGTGIYSIDKSRNALLEELISLDSESMAVNCKQLLHATRRLVDGANLLQGEYSSQYEQQVRKRAESIDVVKYVLSDLYSKLVELSLAFDPKLDFSDLHLSPKEKLLGKPSTPWECVKHSCNRRFLDESLDKATREKFRRSHAVNLRRVGTRRIEFFKEERKAVRIVKEEQNMKARKTVCKICQNGFFKTEYLNDHTSRCSEIHSLKQELLIINKWLIKECKNAMSLKNNIGFELLMAKKVNQQHTNEASGSTGNDRQDEDMLAETRSIDYMNSQTHWGKAMKARDVAKDLVKQKQFKNRKCITTDFKHQEVVQEAHSIDKIEDSGTHDGSSDLQKNGSFSSLGTSDKSGGKQSNYQEDHLGKQKKAGPSIFQKNHKKPSGSFDLKKSGEYRSMFPRDCSDDDSNTEPIKPSPVPDQQPQPNPNAKKSSEEDEEDEPCFGDQLESLDSKSDKQSGGASTLLKSKFGQQYTSQNLPQKAPEVKVFPVTSDKDADLADPPIGIDNLLSDEESSSKQKKQSKDQKSANSSDEQKYKADLSPSLADRLSSPKKPLPSQRFTDVMKHSQDQKNKLPKEELENSFNSEQPPNIAIKTKQLKFADSPHPPANALGGTEAQRAQAMRFRALSKNKNFSQVFQTDLQKETAEENLDRSFSKKDLSKNIQLVKLCNEFFVQMIQFGERIQTKNPFGEIFEEDLSYKLYLEEVVHSDVFDVPVVKNIASKVLEKLEERRVIITRIKKLEMEDAKQRSSLAGAVQTPKVFNMSFNQKRKGNNMLDPLVFKVNQDPKEVRDKDDSDTSKKPAISILSLKRKREEDRQAQPSTGGNPLSADKQPSVCQSDQASQIAPSTPLMSHRQLFQTMRYKNKTYVESKK